MSSKIHKGNNANKWSKRGGGFYAFLSFLTLTSFSYFLYSHEKNVFLAIPETFFKNPIKFAINLTLVFATIYAVLRVWVRPLIGLIAPDTSKLGSKLEWYESNLKQLSPESKTSHRMRWLLSFFLSFGFYIYLPFSGIEFIQRYRPRIFSLYANSKEAIIFKS